MPSYMTHHLFAKMLEHEISAEGRTCFLYGTQGADLLFFSRAITIFRWDSLAKYGVALHHQKTKRSLEFLSDYLAYNHNPLLEGYIKGYLCHYALDRTVHPFVYSQVPKLREITGKSNTWCHLKIETNMDVLVLKHFTGLNVNEYDCRKMFAKDEYSERQVATLYTKMFYSLFGKVIYPSDILECFKQRRMAVKLLYSPKRIKYNLFRFMLPIRPMSTLLQLSHPNTADSNFDYVNKYNEAWVNPFSHEISNESIFDIFDRAQKDVKIMWDMLAANDFSGLDWLDFDGKSCDLFSGKKKRRIRLRLKRRIRKIRNRSRKFRSKSKIKSDD